MESWHTAELRLYHIKLAHYFPDFPALERCTELTNVIFLVHLEKWVSDCDTEGQFREAQQKRAWYAGPPILTSMYPGS